QRPSPADRLDLATVGISLPHPDAADLEPRALVDRDRDLDARAVWREHHARRADLNLEKAAVVVVGAEHQHVALERVLPEAPSGAELEEARLSGDHDVAQIRLVDVMVADERDA